MRAAAVPFGWRRRARTLPSAERLRTDDCPMCNQCKCMCGASRKCVRDEPTMLSRHRVAAVARARCAASAPGPPTALPLRRPLPPPPPSRRAATRSRTRAHSPHTGSVGSGFVSVSRVFGGDSPPTEPHFARNRALDGRLGLRRRPVYGKSISDIASRRTQKREKLASTHAVAHQNVLTGGHSHRHTS